MPRRSTSSPSTRASRPLTEVAIGLVLLKLWLVGGQALFAIGDAGYDERLFLWRAGDLTSGGWLGAYGNLTLVKGPFYPMFIAANFALGVPLFLAQHVLYAAACFLFAAALRPALPGALARLAVFAVLLFNPASFADQPGTRVVREGIYPALTLLVLAAAVGGLLRLEDGRTRANRRWWFLLGAALAAYALCREERIWLVPSLGVLVVGALARRPPWRSAAGGALVASALFAAIVGAVVAKNASRYGVAVTNDVTEGSFPAAYAALLRVEHRAWRRYVPLPAEARRRIYAASPSFAELAPFLEGEVGRSWTFSSCEGAGVCDDIAGGWLLWALRDAACRAGRCSSGEGAERYWRALAGEVRRACRDGRLTCGRGGWGLLPPWQPKYAAPLRDALVRGAVLLMRFGEIRARPSDSVGPEESLSDFRDLTRSRLAPGAMGPAGPLPRQARLDARRIAILEGIAGLYRALSAPLAWAAAIAFLVALGRSVRARRIPDLAVVAAALMLGAVVRVALLALIDATSFPAVNLLYLSPAHPLLLGFVAIALQPALQGGPDFESTRAPNGLP